MLSEHWVGSVGLCFTQGVLLADQSEKLDSMNLLRLMSPVAMILLLPAIAILEPSAPSVALQLLFNEPNFLVLLVGNSSLAYIVNFTNFQITKYTSALTLQVRDSSALCLCCKNWLGMVHTEILEVCILEVCLGSCLRGALHLCVTMKPGQ